jgi:2,3-dihydroxy-p-cumate/2,3-dihydroxybenzoate 3,4-dioxygenase
MIKLQKVCYVRLGTRDLEGATRFATNILGLEVSDWGRNARHFKSDQREHTLCYFDGDPNVQIAGFEVADKDDLDHAAAELEAWSARACRHRQRGRRAHGARVHRFSDPSGNRIEIALAARRQWRPLPWHARRRHHRLQSHRPVHDRRGSGRGLLDAGLQRARQRPHRDAPLLRIDEVHHSIAMFPTDRPGIQHINHQVETADDVMRSLYFLRSAG